VNPPVEPLLTDELAERVAPRPEDREFVESLWKLYAPYAEQHFRQRFADETQQRFWEMYLTCALLRQGKAVVQHPHRRKGRFGPDVQVQDGKRVVWFEAVAAQHGIGSRAVPRRVFPDGRRTEAHSVPDDAMTLRYTAVMKAKCEKYEKYLNGPVASSDICVVGISGGELDYRYSEMMLPRILHAVLPIGRYAVTINTQTMEAVGEGHQFRAEIEGVETTFFADEKYAFISAVLFSYADICNKPEVWGNDFVIVHNPLAKNPLPRGWLRLGREFWVDGGRLQAPAGWDETAQHLH
jgi:type I restriction enzyme S subunit